MKTRRRTAYWCAAIMTATALACEAGDEAAPVPRDPPAGSTLGNPRINALQAGSGGAQIEPGVTYENKRVSLGVNFPYLTVAVITASGSGTYEPIRFPGQDTSTKVYTYGGYWMNGGCYAGISWDFRPDDAWSYASKQYCVMGGAPPATTTDTVVLKGMGFATWSRISSNFPPYCGLSGPECYTYTSGDMSISVAAIPTEFTLTASAYSIQQGDSVTVSGLMAPAMANNVALKFEFLSWSWTPDSSAPAAPYPCSGPQRYWPPNPIECTFAPQKSGVFKMKVVANGNEVERQVRITVNSCPPQDKDFMNNPDFRKKLEQEVAASNPGTNNTLERHGLWNSHRDTGYPFWLPVPPAPGTTMTNCGGDIAPLLPDTAWVDVLVHTHPFGEDEIVHCSGSSVGREYTPGPSNDDWQAVETLSGLVGHPIWGCIADNAGLIACYPSGVLDQNDREKFVDKYQRRNTDGCYIKQH